VREVQLSNRAFSLLELIIVVAILAVLASTAIITVNPGRRLTEARNARRHAEVKILSGAINRHALDNGGDFISNISSTLQMMGTAVSGCRTSCGKGKTNSFTDDIRQEFDEGIYSDTLWGVNNSAVELTPAGKTNSSGIYISSIKDATASTTWTTISWTPLAPYGKELPGSGASETAYSSGNANMNSNALLMHMNESGGAIVDSSGNNKNGTNHGAMYGAAGKLNKALSFSSTTQLTVYPVADSSLYQGSPNSNVGGSTILEVYPWNIGYNKRAVIKFDLSSIPANVNISSAKLFLREYTTYGGTRTLNLHKVIKNWTEAGVTWNKYNGTNNWTNDGGDFNFSASASATVGWTGVLKWDNWDVTQDVKNFYSGPESNLGWILKDSNEDTSQAYWFFYSREGEYQPYLLIDYSTPAGYVDIGQALFVSVPNEVTIEAWLKTDIIPTEDKVAFYHGWKGEIEIGAARNTGKFFTAIDQVAGGWTGVSTTQAYAAGTWHHVAATYKSGDSLKIYVDGISQGSRSLAPDALLNPATYHPTTIGAYTVWNGNRTNKWLGDIDELAVYGRVLSAQEILEHYQRGVLRILFQARSCNDSACAEEDFVGSDGTVSSSYSEIQNSTVNFPSLSLINLPPNQYFQYTMTLETDNLFYSPALNKVVITDDGDGTEFTADACIDLTDDLAGKYIGKIPTDPKDGNIQKSYYAVKKIANYYVQVRACSAELDETIESPPPAL